MHDNCEHKFFWNYVQSRRKGSNDLIVIKLDNGNVLTNEGDIAECMNEYFASVFTAKKKLVIFHHLFLSSYQRQGSQSSTCTLFT